MHALLVVERPLMLLIVESCPICASLVVNANATPATCAPDRGSVIQAGIGEDGQRE
jgi:hypothetical protein